MATNVGHFEGLSFNQKSTSLESVNKYTLTDCNFKAFITLTFNFNNNKKKHKEEEERKKEALRKLEALSSNLGVVSIGLIGTFDFALLPLFVNFKYTQAPYPTFEASANPHISQYDSEV